jgi:hypothetical protein
LGFERVSSTSGARPRSSDATHGLVAAGRTGSREFSPRGALAAARERCWPRGQSKRPFSSCRAFRCARTVRWGFLIGVRGRSRLLKAKWFGRDAGATCEAEWLALVLDAVESREERDGLLRLRHGSRLERAPSRMRVASASITLTLAHRVRPLARRSGGPYGIRAHSRGSPGSFPRSVEARG